MTAEALGHRSQEARNRLHEAQEELRRAQLIVQDREKELVQAVVKDGVVATTATATTAALNPATAAKVGAASMGVAKGAHVAALSWKAHLFAGGVARGVAVGTLFPVDSIKTKKQLGQKINLKIGDIGHEHFKGFGSAILGQIPYGMLVFGTYEMSKTKIFARYPDAPKLPTFLVAAVIGDFLGSVWLTPSEIIKQRMQSGVDKNVMGSIMSIYKAKGFLGFYSGFSGLVARDLPYRALQLPSYEVAREWYSQRYCAPYERAIYPHEAMFVGAGVGMLAAGVTTPLDVVKSRMMVQATGDGVVQVVKNIVKEGGIRGLFAGITPRVGYLGLSNGIFFIMYEFVRGIMSEAPTIPIG
mmetsp:Transcript_83883/g.125752  ORF Transcript_83883/g.125752 Transcript_83883/m.125752 type:complete len:356 (+) Transcript_83883:132-1199(+)